MAVSCGFHQLDGRLSLQFLSHQILVSLYWLPKFNKTNVEHAYMDKYQKFDSSTHFGVVKKPLQKFAWKIFTIS